MLTAKHIMNKDVITVKKDTPIFQSMELMVKHRITGIPVVEDDMSVVGMISEKDLLHLFHNPEDLEEKTVKDCMTQPAICFDENESMSDVCNLLAKQIFRRVPITSEGKLVGIISRADIIEHIVKTKKSANNIPEQLSAHQTHGN
jgi:CBS domain-containing protein